jgi:hypothetical protein
MTVDVFIFCSYKNRQESTGPTVPPRYAFRLEDLRVFHQVRAICHACGRKIDDPERNAAAGPPRLYAVDVA